MKFQNLIFVKSNPGFLNNIYRSKETKRYYALQWDNGYTHYPSFYSASKDGEPDCPIKNDAIPFFVFPSGHEHYECILKESIREKILIERVINDDAEKLYRNFYRCPDPDCDEEWVDESDSKGDEQCPACDTPVSPRKSEPVISPD